MSSISHSLSNALSGLSAASRMAEVVSSNLSNVLTEGYGRRAVDVSSQSVGGRGAGVRVDGVSRLIDRGVLADRRLAEAAQAGAGTISRAQASLETIIGIPGDTGSLSGRLTALDAALAGAAGDPSSDQRLADVLSRLNGVTRALNDDQAGLSRMRQDADADIARQVATLNTALKQVESLNADIIRARNSGGDATALMDQRQRAIDSIAGIVPVKELDRADGRVALITAGGEMLLDGPGPTFGFAAATTIMPHMTYGAGILSGLTRDGVPVSADDAVGKLGGGSLGAAFVLRDETMVAAQSGLDAIARDLIERFADPATDASLAPGQAGLLTDAGAAFDTMAAIGLAGRIAVNAAVDPARGGATSRLRDGIGATMAGPVGNALQLDAWRDALGTARPFAAGGTARSASGHAAALATAVSAARVTADEDTSFAGARYGALREADLAGGVDSDAELAMLLRIEQAYAANAKVVQTIDTMIRTLMEI